MLKSRTTVLSLLFVTFIILSVDLEVSGQTSTTNNDYWFNISSSPLKINVKENNPSLMKLFLENLSQATIIGYQLGCITEKDGLIKIISEDTIENVDINSSITGDNIIYLPKSAHGNYLSTKCNSPTKVAVINVIFVDGGRWTIKK